MLKNASKLITPLQRKRSKTTALLMHNSQCTTGFSKKSRTQCLWNGVEISLGFFTPPMEGAQLKFVHGAFMV
jgi:hypothetical protein